jgi:hypothetical protein
MVNFKVAYLKSIAFIYLALPFLIFFIGWLKLPLGIFASVLLIYCGYKYTKSLSLTDTESISYENITIIIVVLFGWLMFSGVSGFGYQATDYLKHNALFKDLITEKWPISYNINGKEMYLAHYLAYYLPAPTLFGTFNWKIVLIANLIWTALGVFLAILFWLKFIGKYSAYIFIFFVLASGIQIFSLFIQHGWGTIHEILEKIRTHGNLFWLNGLTKNGVQILRITFPSNTDMLFWAPSHAIPCWLGTGILINDLKDKTLKYTPLVISLIAFWSPLVMVGLAPLLFLAIFQDKKREWLNIENLLYGPFIFAIIGSFLLSIDAKNILHHFIFTDRSGIDAISMKRQIFTYCNFLFFEVIIWWLPAYWVIRNDENKLFKQLYWVVFVLLSIIPLFQYGVWNDWCSRVSMPTLFLFHALIIVSFLRANFKQKVIFLSIFLLALIGPAIAILGSARNYSNNFNWVPPTYDSIKLIPEATKSWPIDQYVADKNSFFFKYLAKSN